jgi:hypothetical protein
MSCRNRRATGVIRPVAAVPSSVIPNPKRWIMNMEVLSKYVGLRTGRHDTLLGTGLLLALVVGCPHESALRAAAYTSDAVTQVRVLVGPDPAFHPLRGWAEMPQPGAPRGFVKLPVACNAGRRGPRIWLCYRRGPLQEVPLAAVRVATEGSLEGSGWEKIPVPLGRSVTGLPVRLYYRRASDQGEPVVTDLLLRTRFGSVRGYEYGGRVPGEGSGANAAYLYYKLEDAASVQGPPFAQGVRPEMLNAPDTEYEIARAQIDDDHLLVRLQKLEVKHATVSSRMPFRRTEVIKRGLSRQEMNQVARSLNVGLNGDYAGLKECVGLTLGWTSSATYSASEETTLTEEVNLAAAEHDRYYAFATVLDVLRVREIASGKVVGEAVSRSDNIGYFVTDRYGSWKSAPE